MNRLQARCAATQSHVEETHRSYPDFSPRAAIIVRLLKFLVREIRDQSNQVLKAWELNHSEFNLLMMLYGTPSHALSPSELGECTSEKQTNITRLICRLEEKGLIDRAADPEDGRRTVLSLTLKGRETVEEFLPAISRLLTLEMGQLTELEQQMLELLLKKMLSGMPADSQELADAIAS